MSTREHRITDGPRQGRWWIFFRRAYRVWVAIIPAIAVMAALVAVFRVEDAVEANKRAIEAIEIESADRRDQTCQIFEAQHLANVTRLKRTYRYLEGLPRAEWGSTLTLAVLDGLPALETEARIDQAPPYCDEPGEAQEFLFKKSKGKEGLPPVGLPEPDPHVPHRRSFAHLARQP